METICDAFLEYLYLFILGGVLTCFLWKCCCLRNMTQVTILPVLFYLAWLPASSAAYRRAVEKRGGVRRRVQYIHDDEQ
jgi:hypothetical protein